MTPTSDFRSPPRRPIAVPLWPGCLIVVALTSLLSYWGCGGFNGTLSTCGGAVAALALSPFMPTTIMRQNELTGDGDSDGKTNINKTVARRASTRRGLGARAGSDTVLSSGEAGAVVALHPGQFRGTLALKSERIVYCPIQKVACSEWLKVFRWIDGHEDWTEPRHNKHGLYVLEEMGVEHANQILNSPEWLKLAVVREPAERLLSCFLQKCTQWNMKGEYMNCPYLELWPDLFGRDHFPDGVPRQPNEETLSVAMEAFRTKGRDAMFASYVDSITRKVKKYPCAQNLHWSPQFCHCSLDLTSPVFHIVGWSNMTEEVSAAILPFASSRDRGLEIVGFLAERMKSNHERKGKKTSAGSSPQQSYTAEMLQAVHEAYAKDYELFSRYWD